ncbi:uncharacterized protein LOC125955399 [Anopheles darlingi]|uniref:uncharacterized protein LOC125955399 n=1 Tax=Anopheles darlingi TaxID=43151 RepID=UPI0021005A52|nr:uncharacterized protein LOC125955399 [Anopheles darlingi]
MEALGSSHENQNQVQKNLSGLKHALHGTSYQLELGMVVCLANVKKAFDPANGFSFTVAAEDPSAGMFDDIVYNFEDGEKKGILKIQVKHKLGSPAPNITVTNFTTTRDTKNSFAILKYFTSFCDQQQSTTDLEGFIICTNADITDKAKEMWKTVVPAVTDDSATSLDSYVSSLFDSIGGKYYQLNYDKLWAADGTFSNFHQLLRKCSKRARLAKLLVEATKPNKNITNSNSLFKEYRQAILNVIERKIDEASTSDSYGFTNEFLDSSFFNSMPGYEAFRQEFEEQYQEEFTIGGCVWDVLKQKRVYVSQPFLSDENNPDPSSETFPNDNVDESFKSFCDRFRLVCGTYSGQRLDDAIVEIWRSLHTDYDHMAIGHRKGCLEEKVATERLFKTNFDWVMDPFAKPLQSEDIKKDFENIENTLAYMKLKGISDKLGRKVVTSSFRLSHDVLEASSLYKRVETESFLQLEAYDIPFGATVISDILLVQG